MQNMITRVLFAVKVWKTHSQNCESVVQRMSNRKDPERPVVVVEGPQKLIRIKERP